jgi:hypothetical protein
MAGKFIIGHERQMAKRAIHAKFVCICVCVCVLFANATSYWFPPPQLPKRLLFLLNDDLWQQCLTFLLRNDACEAESMGSGEDRKDDMVCMQYARRKNQSCQSPLPVFLGMREFSFLFG